MYSVYMMMVQFAVKSHENFIFRQIILRLAVTKQTHSIHYTALPLPPSSTPQLNPYDQHNINRQKTTTDKNVHHKTNSINFQLNEPEDGLNPNDSIKVGYAKQEDVVAMSATEEVCLFSKSFYLFLCVHHTTPTY